jgi:hypothetical protein
MDTDGEEKRTADFADYADRVRRVGAVLLHLHDRCNQSATNLRNRRNLRLVRAQATWLAADGARMDTDGEEKRTADFADYADWVKRAAPARRSRDLPVRDQRRSTRSTDGAAASPPSPQPICAIGGICGWSGRRRSSRSPEPFSFAVAQDRPGGGGDRRGVSAVCFTLSPGPVVTLSSQERATGHSHTGHSLFPLCPLRRPVLSASVLIRVDLR